MSHAPVRTYFVPTCSTGNNATSFLVDSTTGFVTAPSATPGPFRGRWATFGVKGTIKVGDQPVTLSLKALTGSAGTSADWETENTGTVVLSASTTYPIRWRPQGADFQASILNGATGPSALIAHLELVPVEEVET